MAPPHDSARAQAVAARPHPDSARAQAVAARPHPLTLEEELAQAEREFDDGEYVEVPLGALDNWVETGALPWLESPSSARR